MSSLNTSGSGTDSLYTSNENSWRMHGAFVPNTVWSLPYILNDLMGTVVMNLHYMNKTELAFKQEEEERDEMLAEARDGKKSCEI